MRATLSLSSYTSALQQAGSMRTEHRHEQTLLLQVRQVRKRKTGWPRVLHEILRWRKPRHSGNVCQHGRPEANDRHMATPFCALMKLQEELCRGRDWHTQTPDTLCLPAASSQQLLPSWLKRSQHKQRKFTNNRQGIQKVRHTLALLQTAWRLSSLRGHSSQQLQNTTKQARFGTPPRCLARFLLPGGEP